MPPVQANHSPPFSLSLKYYYSIWIEKNDSFFNSVKLFIIKKQTCTQQISIIRYHINAIKDGGMQ